MLATLTTLVRAGARRFAQIQHLAGCSRERPARPPFAAAFRAYHGRQHQSGTDEHRIPGGPRERLRHERNLSKVQAQLIDLNNAVKVLQAPLLLRRLLRRSSRHLGGPPPGGAAAAGPPAGLSAQQLYDSAMRDRSGGNPDLALQGFQEYLKWFGTSELAPNAQFYVGQIYYDKGDFDKP